MSVATASGNMQGFVSLKIASLPFLILRYLLLILVSLLFLPFFNFLLMSLFVFANLLFFSYLFFSQNLFSHIIICFTQIKCLSPPKKKNSSTLFFSFKISPLIETRNLFLLLMLLLPNHLSSPLYLSLTFPNS